MPQNKTVSSLISEFRSRGNRVAIIDRTEVRRFVHTYEELHGHIERAMTWLQHRYEVQRGDRVLLWAPNSYWWAVVYFASMRMGAVVVPVDFSSSYERAAKIAELAGVKLVIQSQFKAERFETANSVLVENVEHYLQSCLPTDFAPVLDANDLAEIMYTSGTTADPKGVMLTHGNLMANLLSVTKHIAVEEDFRFLSLLPLSHMFEQQAGFLVPLYKGCSITYLQTLKPSAILEAFAQEDISVSVLVPRLLQVLKTSVEGSLREKGLLSLFNKLRQHAEEKSLGYRRALFTLIRKKFGKNFQFFVSGGSALDADVFGFWQALGMPVIEGYGLTETAPVATAHTRQRQVARSAGIAVPDVEVVIASDREILIRGANVFQGYWNNPQATKEAFTVDGFFKTGDLGSLKDGLLFIDGRKKEMIVLPSGMNVFPDDIEGVLNELSGVVKSCVVGKKNEDGEQVHAVLILTNAGQDPKEIIRQANAKLESTQQITDYTIWPEAKFPETSTLKIQRVKVKDAIGKSAGASGQVSMVGDELQNLLSQITKKEVTSIIDSANLLSDLGLTSIGRLELVTYLEQKFRLDVEEDAITQNTTVADLRRIIERREKTKSSDMLRPWTNSAPVRWFRAMASIPRFLFYRIFMKLEIEGLENLQGLEGPVIFIANHLRYLDTAAIYYSLPKRFRFNMGVAAREEAFRGGKTLTDRIGQRVMYEYTTVVLNVFPLPQTRGFRRSLKFMGQMIDGGTSVLIFPEGHHSPDGSLKEFLPGLGLMVKALQVPVVPIRLSGTDAIIPNKDNFFPSHRGTVKVTFGKPLQFGLEAPSQIVERSREAVASL